MKNKLVLLFSAAILFAASCKQPQSGGDITISPESGTTYKTGDVVTLQVHFPNDVKPDSVVYTLDSVKIGSKKDTSAITLKTDSLRMGSRGITAKFYRNGQVQDISTNIVVMPAKAPEELTYKVEKVYPHDTGSYTEGLLYQDGYLYESTGAKGESALKKVDLETGKTVKIAKIDPKVFGEGSAIIGDKIIMLTYTEHIGYIFDKNTFKQIGTFNNNVGIEGWGVTFDGKKLYMDDKTNTIYFLNKDNYHQMGYIEVYDNKGKVDSVNELEYIHGKLYSNIYMKDDIIVIDPKTGAVLQRADMSRLWPEKDRPAGYYENANVLNGIAWDEKGQRLFVTGKKWPHLYQIKFSKM